MLNATVTSTPAVTVRTSGDARGREHQSPPRSITAICTINFNVVTVDAFRTMNAATAPTTAGISRTRRGARAIPINSSASAESAFRSRIAVTAIMTVETSRMSTIAVSAAMINSNATTLSACRDRIIATVMRTAPTGRTT